jgi:hypothetical protein
MGGQVALVGPDGQTVVLDADPTRTSAGSLEDTLAIKVHGGDMSVGRVEFEADLTVYQVMQNAAFSVEARPYSKTAEINIGTRHLRIIWLANVDTLRQLREVCEKAEQVLLGVATEPANEGHGETAENQDND